VIAPREFVERAKRTESPVLRPAFLRGMGAVQWARRGHAVRRAVIERYLAGSEEPKLQIGAGPLGIDGWLNSDLIAGDVYLDLERPLPLPDRSFAYAFGEHVIEHIAEHRVARLLAELHRVLRPGGVLRLVTPDLRKLIALYEDRSDVVSRAEYGAWLSGVTGKRYDQPAQMLNDNLRLWGHRYIYDFDDLRARLLTAGFASVQRVEPLASAHGPLNGLERHGGAAWVNRAEGLCVEATRAA
jgi:predicted SAM-dependent methyltransferase